jgi:FixJ family two-component response regulator
MSIERTVEETRGPAVYVVDDDPSVRKALTRFLESAGMEVSSYPCAADFLASEHSDRPACLLLDIEMPGLSGLELQEELRHRDLAPAIVFISGHGTVPRSVRALKMGAVDFLQKPFDDEQLLAAIRQAIDKDSRSKQLLIERATLGSRYVTLTSREQEVMDLVVTGLLNKQIAGRLGTSEKTVKVHRGRVMRKMQADSLPDLVRMAERLRASTAPE